MKSLGILSFAFLMLTGFSAQAEPQTKLDFKAANERLLKGDAKGALALYEHLSREGLVHADLYYNLGNTYAALNRPIDAIIAYERSLLLDPGAESTQHNLAQIRKNIDPRYEQVSSEDLPAEPIDTIHSLIGGLDQNLFAWLLLFANASLFLCLGLLRYGQKPHLRKIAVTGIGVTIICILFSGTVTFGYYLISGDRQAVLTTNSALKSGPNQRFEATDQASAGTRVRILDKQNEWLEVKTRLGTTGWIPVDKLTEL